ncbi:hypothetical protein [Vulcanisaeta moutnovskia]|nr:hypothetical protein [Vulcanisaeta moutnovskia]
MAKDLQKLSISKAYEEGISKRALYGFSISFASSAPLFILIKGILWPSNLFYIFVFSVIISIWIYYKLEEMFIEPEFERWSIEALKLLHDAELRISLQLASIITLGAFAGILVLWLNVLLPSIPIEARTSSYSLLFQAVIAFIIIHLLFGLWMAYFVPILRRLSRIRLIINKKCAETN